MLKCKFEFFWAVDQSLAEQQISGVGEEEENVVPLFTEQECVFFWFEKRIFCLFLFLFFSGVLSAIEAPSCY